MPARWFSVLLALAMPPLAFVYLDKFVLAILYLIAALLIITTGYIFTYDLVITILKIALAIVAASHAFKIANLTDKRENKKWYTKWWGVLLIPITIVMIGFFTRLYVVESFTIMSSSMSPTLERGDMVIIGKWGIRNSNINDINSRNSGQNTLASFDRGEIVVFSPASGGSQIIQRIIGRPGDRVEFSNRQLHINGESVKTIAHSKETYREHFGQRVVTVRYSPMADNSAPLQWVVPHDGYFLMGDNRDGSRDSRSFGYVPAANISGRLIFHWRKK